MQNNRAAILTFPVQHSVFISPDQSEIEQIDEIELTPHIQIQETVDEVIVSGYLKLEGKYVGKPPKFPDIPSNEKEMPVTGYVDSVVFNPFAMNPDDFEEESERTTFIEKIPVHICIARSKIEDIEQMYASILSFDYEIQSTRKLSIIAELALNGVKNAGFASSATEETKLLQTKFEYVASHQEAEETQESEASSRPADDKGEEDSTQSEATPAIFIPKEEQAIAETDKEDDVVQETDAAAPPQPTIQSVKMEEGRKDEEITEPSVEAKMMKEQPVQAEAVKAEEQPVQAEAVKAEEQPVQAEAVKAEEQPVQAEAVKAEEQPVQAEAVKAEEQPIQAEAVKAEEQPVQAEAAKTEEQSVQAEAVEKTIQANGTEEEARSHTPETKQQETDVQSTETEAELTEESASVTVPDVQSKAHDECNEEKENRAEEREEAKVSITLKGTKRDPVTVTTPFLSSYGQRGENEAIERSAEEEEAVEEVRDEEEAPGEEEETLEEDKKGSAFYLMSFMKQKEEKFTRLKMCIAQQDETLEEIAEKYNVSVIDIAQANGLHSSATVAKGQVLYIPVKA
ncbi:LysM peptidoglycan-binding domain-containing protein [Aneurinibacillus thermoaerophilus]|uniref:LysM peptidoglycan-binding domain-containing protein n=1 Tax=Aneurinibacillus thermoaerophilus TaxID=143495 RepID=A0ABX8Y8Y6_ANETH|nr:LysM domain-containing protein [Aneurinibacillus thermoaerophilus]QYY42137.1 LysM peptidoglycan-binding domain-containing protein [Aneurinibacillus thermoaerophilus]